MDAKAPRFNDHKSVNIRNIDRFGIVKPRVLSRDQSVSIEIESTI